MNKKEKLYSILIITSAISQCCYEVAKTNPELATNFGLYAITTLGIADMLEQLDIPISIYDNLKINENNEITLKTR